MGKIWPHSIQFHLNHHRRFYASAGLGVLVWLLTGMTRLPLHLAMAGNTFFGVYLLTMVHMAGRTTPLELRNRAVSADEGIVVIVVITLAAITLSLGSIFALVNAPRKPDALQLGLSIISVPLGWITLHTVMALHYAHLFYARDPSRLVRDAAGLQFPATQEPDSWDFLYYSFVVGMTAQVSDVQVLSAEMRRVTLVHGVVSFFFNTVILALAVNGALGSAR
jgi:uncharacterized membrane protein